MKRLLFDIGMLSRREVIVVLSCSLLFLLFQYFVVGLMPAQVIMVVLFITLYMAHPVTRMIALAMLPFIAFEISYDWMRLYPNYRVNPIDIEGIYNTELRLFGISSEGTTVIPGAFFSLNHNVAGDILAGLFYLCWVPGPIALGLWLLFKGEYGWYVHFSLCFLLVNVIGFIGYYIHPAAPPWYALQFGFEPDFSTPGNVAGLARFDELVGLPVFQSIYVNNSNIFAAVPSLHAAYMLVATVYAALSRRRRLIVVLCALVTVGIWLTAVYSCHHYIIDVLLGILTAVLGVLLFEKMLMRWHPFRHFVKAYANLLANMVAQQNVK